MRTLKRTMLVVFVSVFAVSSLVFAQPYDEGDFDKGGPSMEGKEYGRHQKGEMFDHLKEELGLSEEQQEQLKEKRKNHRAEAKEIHTAIKTKREELKNALHDMNVDEGTIKSIAAEVKNLQGKQVDARVNGILETKSILTPEQFQKLQAMHEKNKGKRKQGRSKKQWRGFKEDQQGW